MSTAHRVHCATPTANATTSGDPTGTLSVRQAFITELRRRFRRVKGLIRQTVGYENDALGLKQDAPDPLFANADPREDFESTTQRGLARQFERWLAQAFAAEVLLPVDSGQVAQGEHWTGDFVRQAYITGTKQATGLLFQAGGQGIRPLDQEEITNRPIAVDQLQTLYTKTFSNLEGITDDSAQTIREELTTGLAEGDNPREMADRLTEKVDTIESKRAETLARTEIIESHSTATLDRYEEAGVDVVSHGVWTTADDDRVCPVCRALEGLEATVDEMRETEFQMDGVSFDVKLRPPAHPNCRCVIRPKVGADPPETPLSERLPDQTAPA